MGPAPEVANIDATCTLQLPMTSYPKNKIKVLLLENISQTAIASFSTEGFQIVRPSASSACTYTSCLHNMCVQMQAIQSFDVGGGVFTGHSSCLGKILSIMTMIMIQH